MNICRTVITTLAAAGLVLAGAVTPAQPADAYSPITARTGTSSEDGYGEAAVIIDEIYGKLRYHVACDEGEPDGLRVISYLMVGNYAPWVAVDKGGAGNGCASQPSYDGSYIGPGTTVVLKVCLRDGADGADILCGRTTETV